jgi:HEAT repeat protein
MPRKALVKVLVLLAAVSAGCRQQREVLRANPNQAVLDAKVTALDLVDHPNAMVRIRALEAVSRFMMDQHGMLLVGALEDPASSVRTVAAMAVGDMRYTPALGRLKQMVSMDRSVGERQYTVLPAVVYALYRLGEDGYLKLLGPLLLSDGETIRTNTAIAMGRIGDPRALAPLKETIWREEYETRLIFDTAMAQLGDPAAKGRLEAYVHGRYVDLRIGGLQALAAHNPDRASKLLPSLAMDAKEHPAVRLTAIGELAQMGMAHQEMYAFAREALGQPEKVIREAFDVDDDKAVNAELTQFVRHQSIWALGWFPSHPETVDRLLGYMESEDPNLRILAAVSVLRLLPEAVEAEPAAAALPKTVSESDRTPGVVEDPLAPVVPTTPGGRLKTSGVKD